MTVPSSNDHSGPYNGNGVTTAFDYTFRIVDASHLQVVLTDADDEETTLVNGADYTVSDVGEDDGGQIICTSAPASGTTINIVRNVPFTQETDLENQGAYYAETVEDALDLAVMRDQQMAEQLRRTWKAPFGQAGENRNVAVVPEGHIWIADSDGNMIDGGDGSAVLAGASQAAAAAAAALVSETNAANYAEQSVASATFARPVASIITSLPTSPANGDRYLVAHSGTSGTLVGKEDQVVERVAGVWVYSGSPLDGQQIYLQSTQQRQKYIAAISAWQILNSKLVFVSDFASLTAADTFAAAAGMTLLLDQDITLAADTTLSARVRGHGGIIALNGHTLAGDFWAPPSTQMFSGATGGVRPSLPCEASVGWFGVKGGAQTYLKGAITSGHPDFTDTTNQPFKPADIGKTLRLAGAGAAGADLITTISAYVSPSAVTLADNASTTVSDATYQFGVDDTDAWKLAFAFAGSSTNYPSQVGYAPVTLIHGLGPSITTASLYAELIYGLIFRPGSQLWPIGSGFLALEVGETSTPGIYQCGHFDIDVAGFGQALDGLVCEGLSNGTANLLRAEGFDGKGVHCLSFNNMHVKYVQTVSCGNATAGNWALNLDAMSGGDPCNSCVFEKLDCELANTQGIHITANSFNNRYGLIHAERATGVDGTPLHSLSFSGASECGPINISASNGYGTVKFDYCADARIGATRIFPVSGADNMHVTYIGNAGTQTVFSWLQCNDFSCVGNGTGQFKILGGSIGTVSVIGWDTPLVFDDVVIANLSLDYIGGTPDRSLSKLITFNRCSITTSFSGTVGGVRGNATFNQCSFGFAMTVAGGSYVFNEPYFASNLTIHGTNTWIRDGQIIGNYTDNDAGAVRLSGNTAIGGNVAKTGTNSGTLFGPDVVVTGTVATAFASFPGSGGFAVGETHYVPSAASGAPFGYRLTSTGAKSMGNLA